MANKVSAESETTWWAYPRGFRRFWWAFLVLALGYAVLVLTSDDVPELLYIAAVLNIVTAVANIIAGRGRTTLDQTGITISELRTRRASWDDIVEVRSDVPGRWSTKTQARLTSGEVWVLPTVPPEDLPEVRRWRTPPEHDIDTADQR